MKHTMEQWKDYVFVSMKQNQATGELRIRLKPPATLILSREELKEIKAFLED
jgi:hypothetical protein